jgi:hypothetical protein
MSLKLFHYPSMDRMPPVRWPVTDSVCRWFRTTPALRVILHFYIKSMTIKRVYCCALGSRRAIEPYCSGCRETQSNIVRLEILSHILI